MDADIRDYIFWMKAQGLSANTVKQRVGFATARLAEWGTFDLPSDILADWLAMRDGWTRTTYFNHLHSLFGWLVEEGHLDVDPLARYRRPPVPAPSPKPLAPHHVRLVLEEATGDLRTWLLLGLLAGLRSHEIAKVHGKDVTGESITVLGKGGQLASIPTHPALWALAQSYPRDGYWFPSVQARREYVSKSNVENKIRAHLRACGIESGAVHRLRYSYGTNLDRAGVRTRVIQELLRHKSLATTQRYLDVSSEERAAAIRMLVA